MATPTYSIYIDGKIQKAFTSGDSTTDRKEAEEMYDSLKRISYSEGTKLELHVSSRGIEKTLREEEICVSEFVAETEQTPEYHYDSYEPGAL